MWLFWMLKFYLSHCYGDKDEESWIRLIIVTMIINNSNDDDDDDNDNDNFNNNYSHLQRKPILCQVFYSCCH